VLPRWFRVLLVVDVALVAAVAVLGARLALDGARAAAPVIRWERPPRLPAPAPGATAVPAPPATAPAGAHPGQTRLDASLLRDLDADTAATAAAQQGLLGRLEEVIRQQIVTLLERSEQAGRGG
jgi:hypothetical protein